MPDRPGHYHRHRFPAEVISHAVLLYYRFPLSHRDVEEMLAYRGITVSYESIRRWAFLFGDRFAHHLRHRERKAGSTWHLDEMTVKIAGQTSWLWRAVDESGLELDILVQEHRDAEAAERFFRRLLDRVDDLPEKIVTDKLASYGAAKRRVPELGGTEHLEVKSEDRLNNRVEQAHQPTRLRETRMGRFKSERQAQRFVSIFGRFRNHFCPGRHRLTASEYREVMAERRATWREVTAPGALT